MVGDPFRGWVNSQRWGAPLKGLRQFSQTRPNGFLRNPQDL